MMPVVTNIVGIKPNHSLKETFQNKLLLILVGLYNDQDFENKFGPDPIIGLCIIVSFSTESVGITPGLISV